MIDRSHRFPLRANATVFQTFQRYRSKSFFAYIQKNDDKLLVSVITPKKRYPKATMRNAMKRRIVESIRSTFPLDYPVSLICVVRASSSTSYSTLLSEFAELKKYLDPRM